jgi:ribonuclease T1
MMNFKTLLLGTALAIATWTSNGLGNLNSQSVQALDRSTSAASIPIVSIQRLPVEAKNTIKLINQGGPFPYRKDGTVFGNRERRLPTTTLGTYREYTVSTPGSRDRGARRIISGQNIKYYTPDHYRSFQRIQE